MRRRIHTRLDILHPDLSARMSEKSKLADHTTCCVFLPGDPVMEGLSKSQATMGQRSYSRLFGACHLQSYGGILVLETTRWWTSKVAETGTTMETPKVIVLILNLFRCGKLNFHCVKLQPHRQIWIISCQVLSTCRPWYQSPHQRWLINGGNIYLNFILLLCVILCQLAH